MKRKKAEKAEKGEVKEYTLNDNTVGSRKWGVIEIIANNTTVIVKTNRGDEHRFGFDFFKCPERGLNQNK